MSTASGKNTVLGVGLYGSTYHNIRSSLSPSFWRDAEHAAAHFLCARSDRSESDHIAVNLPGPYKTYLVKDVNNEIILKTP